MKIAAESTDKFERFKLVMAMGVAGLYLSISQGKPFNP